MSIFSYYDSLKLLSHSGDKKQRIMKKITKSYEANNDLTLFTVVGEISFDEIWAQTRILYEGVPEKLVLWNFSLGTVGRISSEEVKKIAQKGGQISRKIEGGKGAIFAPKDLEYGMARVFKVFCEENDFPVEVEVFRDEIVARKWLLLNSIDSS